jgi:hypothetical protein
MSQQERHAQLLGILRDMRAEVQNLRRTLMEMLEKEALVDAEMRANEILETLQDQTPIYDYNAVQINARLTELRELVGENPGLYDRYGDEITHIENFWERATLTWPPVPNPALDGSLPSGEAAIAAAGEVLRLAHNTVADLDRLIYHCGLLTIPSRLTQHLEQLRIGQRLDFHASFADEVADDEDRQAILEYIHARPVSLPNGIVDVENGVVYHAARTAARRRWSYIFIALAVLTGALLVFVIGQIGQVVDLPDWPVQDDETLNLLVGYAFVVVGGVAHIGVDAIKQARTNSNRSLLAIEDWFAWIHINESGIIIGIAFLWVGFAGLLFLMGDVEWQTAFLVGYSIDSFVDMFLQRFNNNLKARSRAFVA